MRAASVKAFVDKVLSSSSAIPFRSFLPQSPPPPYLTASFPLHGVADHRIVGLRNTLLTCCSGNFFCFNLPGCYSSGAIGNKRRQPCSAWTSDKFPKYHSIHGKPYLYHHHHHHHVPSSVSEGWCVIFLQSLSSANLLTSSYFFFCINCITSSIHVLLGRPLVLFQSNFPSRTSKALKPLEPLNTYPVFANFCFTIFSWSVACLRFSLIYTVRHN